MYLSGVRWYDSEAGRFISRDLIINNNLYFYTSNNPLKYIDPSGEFSPWVWYWILLYWEAHLGWKIGEKIANICINLSEGESALVEIIPPGTFLGPNFGFGIKIYKDKCGKCDYDIVLTVPYS